MNPQAVTGRGLELGGTCLAGASYGLSGLVAAVCGTSRNCPVLGLFWQVGSGRVVACQGSERVHACRVDACLSTSCSVGYGQALEPVMLSLALSGRGRARRGLSWNLSRCVSAGLVPARRFASWLGTCHVEPIMGVSRRGRSLPVVASHVMSTRVLELVASMLVDAGRCQEWLVDAGHGRASQVMSFLFLELGVPGLVSLWRSMSQQVSARNLSARFEPRQVGPCRVASRYSQPLGELQ